MIIIIILSMNDIMNNLPLLCCLCMCLVFVPVVALFVYLIIRGRNQAWIGTVTEKIENTGMDEDGDPKQYLSIALKLDDGKNVKIAVTSQKYKEWKVGDRLQKKSGQNWPEKIN
jgi:hypothetical protein